MIRVFAVSDVIFYCQFVVVNKQIQSDGIKDTIDQLNGKTNKV